MITFEDLIRVGLTSPQKMLDESDRLLILADRCKKAAWTIGRYKDLCNDAYFWSQASAVRLNQGKEENK